MPIQQVKETIELLADRQTKMLVAQKKWTDNKRIQKKKKALIRELEAMTAAIAEKAISKPDSRRTFR